MFCHEIANKSIENLRFIPKQKIWKYILKLAWKVYLEMVMFTSSNGIWYHVIKIYSIYCFMLYNKAALTFYKYAYPLREVDSDHYWHNEESPLLLPGLKLSVWKKYVYVMPTQIFPSSYWSATSSWVNHKLGPKMLTNVHFDGEGKCNVRNYF